MNNDIVDINAPDVRAKLELSTRPEPAKLPDNLRNFIEVYKNEKTLTRACNMLKIDRYDIDLALVTNPNFEACMLYAEKELQDELEYAVMAKAGLLGDEVYSRYKKGHTPTAFAMLKSKHSGYRGKAKIGSATQINANKVTINNKGSEGTIQATTETGSISQ